MSGPLAGKTALITGGSKGIEAATSLLLAKSGADVAINYSSATPAQPRTPPSILATSAAPYSSRATPASVQDIETMVFATVKGNRQDGQLVIPCAAVMILKPLAAITGGGL